MNFKLRLRPIAKDVLLSSLTQVIITVSLLAIYRIILIHFPSEGIGKYSLIKRVSELFRPLMILGLEIGLPRYIAISKNGTQRASYIKASFIAVGLCTFFFLGIINIFKNYFAMVFFGGIIYSQLITPFSLMLLGLTLHLLVYSYFRGRLFVEVFTSLRVVNLAIIPFFVFAFFKNNITIELAMVLIGINIFIVSLLFFLFHVKEILNFSKNTQTWKSLKELLHYSLPRIPVDFALLALISLGPIFLVHFASIEYAGYFSIAISLFNAIATTTAPLGVILLPKVSKLIAKGKEIIIEKNLHLLIAIVSQCFIFLTVQLIIFSDTIIKYWLGPEGVKNIVLPMRIMFISIIFYGFYVTIRSILDAIKTKPINTINLSISLCIFIVMSWVQLSSLNLFKPIISVSIAFTFAMIILGTLTYISIRMIYPTNFKKDLKCLLIAISVNFLIGTITIWLKPFVTLKLYYLITFELLLVVTYLLILWLLKVEWIRQIPKLIMGSSD